MVTNFLCSRAAGPVVPVILPQPPSFPPSDFWIAGSWNLLENQVHVKFCLGPLSCRTRVVLAQRSMNRTMNIPIYATGFFLPFPFRGGSRIAPSFKPSHLGPAVPAGTPKARVQSPLPPNFRFPHPLPLRVFSPLVTELSDIVHPHLSSPQIKFFLFSPISRKSRSCGLPRHPSFHLPGTGDRTPGRYQHSLCSLYSQTNPFLWE